MVVVGWLSQRFLVEWLNGVLEWLNGVREYSCWMPEWDAQSTREKVGMLGWHGWLNGLNGVMGWHGWLHGLMDESLMVEWIEWIDGLIGNVIIEWLTD